MVRLCDSVFCSRMVATETPLSSFYTRSMPLFSDLLTGFSWVVCADHSGRTVLGFKEPKSYCIISPSSLSFRKPRAVFCSLFFLCSFPSPCLVLLAPLQMFRCADLSDVVVYRSGVICQIVNVQLGILRGENRKGASCHHASDITPAFHFLLLTNTMCLLRFPIISIQLGEVINRKQSILYDLLNVKQVAYLVLLVYLHWINLLTKMFELFTLVSNLEKEEEIK